MAQNIWHRNMMPFATQQKRHENPVNSKKTA